MKIANIMENLWSFYFFLFSNKIVNEIIQAKNAILHFLLLFLEHFVYVASFFFSCIDFTNYMISSFWHFQFEGSKKITPMLLLVGLGLGIDVGGIFYLKWRHVLVIFLKQKSCQK